MDKQVEVEVPLDGPDDLLDAVSPLVRAAYKMNAESTELKFKCGEEHYVVKVKRVKATNPPPPSEAEKC